MALLRASRNGAPLCLASGHRTTEEKPGRRRDRGLSSNVAWQLATYSLIEGAGGLLALSLGVLASMTGAQPGGAETVYNGRPGSTMQRKQFKDRGQHSTEPREHMEKRSVRVADIP